MKLIREQYYNFEGIKSPKKQNRILDILSYCKEIRDTAYPMKDSKVTELEIVEFRAHKDKDIIYISGSLSLIDCSRSENRTFEAYIFDEEGKARVYMDITRLNVEDEPKLIRTNEELIEDEKNVMSVTLYSSSDSQAPKSFTAEFPKNYDNNFMLKEKSKQLSAL